MSQTNESPKKETPKQEEKSGEADQEVALPAAAGEHSEEAQGASHKSLRFLSRIVEYLSDLVITLYKV